MNLKHQFQRVLDDIFEFPDPLPAHGAIDDFVIEACCHDDLVIPLRPRSALGLDRDGHLLGGANGQDPCLRRVDDGCESLDGSVHSHVADGEGTALELFGLQFAILGAPGQIFDLSGDAFQSQAFDTLDNGRHQADRGGDGHTDVDGVELTNDALFGAPARIGGRDLPTSDGASLDQEIVEGQSELAVGRGVQGQPKFEQLGYGDAGRYVVMRVLIHRVGQTSGDGSPHHRRRVVLVRGPCRCCRATSRARRSILVDVLFRYLTPGPRALDVLETHAFLQRERLDIWADRWLSF